MRILFVNHFPLTGSGSGVYTANLAKSLTRKGHQTAICFPENRCKYELYDGIDLFPVFFSGEENLPVEMQASKMNFPCFTTHPRSKFAYKDMSDEQREEYIRIFKDAINRAIDMFKPDIVHAQHIWVLAGVAADCCAKKDIPMVATSHGTDLLGIKEEIESGINWGTEYAHKAIEYASHIITISRDNDREIRNILPESVPKLKLITNGVDIHVFYLDESVSRKEVLNELGITKEFKNVVSFVGKLTAIKRVNVLLDAAALYENDETITLIAGDGELRNELEAQSRDLKLKNVIFLGNKPHDILNKIYNIADCSLIQSKKEPFGLVALEAMACGTPVIATNQGGLPDFVTEDVGILVDVDDHEGLANAVKMILSGQIKFDRRKTAEKIKNNYSQDIIIDHFIEVYEENLRNKA